MTQLHEDPENNYERMLDRLGLDCSEYGCWKPVRGFALVPVSHSETWYKEFRLCAEHLAGKQVTRWLES